MTEQEFDQQVWRRFDVVTTDTGIETTVMNVCFSSRSVRIYVKNAPPEWLPCNRIVTHTTRKGGDADDSAIIEELHNKVLNQANQIERLQEENMSLKEKVSANRYADILRAVNTIQQGLAEKKSKLEKIDRGLNLIVETLARIEVNP